MKQARRHSIEKVEYGPDYNKEQGEPQVAINGHNDGDTTRNEVATGYYIGYVAGDFVCHLYAPFI
jgi:hypothetical protein